LLTGRTGENHEVSKVGRFEIADVINIGTVEGELDLELIAKTYFGAGDGCGEGLGEEPAACGNKHKEEEYEV
jgi:hypothetical protein